MKPTALFLVGLVLGVIGTGVGFMWDEIWPRKVPEAVQELVELPLEKYATDRLVTRIPEGGEIVLDEPVATESAYTAYEFHFTSDGKRVNGLAHIPKECIEDKCPVIAQFRGFIERDGYVSGAGTRRSAAVFASNGFISVAPDFLGYGGSDMPSEDIFEERFQKYTVGLDMISAVKKWERFNGKLGVWGHSNGGQVTLTVLQALGEPVPAVLWNPVSAPFPYSILFYSDDTPDFGKSLRKELAEFEENYNADLYAVVNYLDRLTGPILLQQGSVDELVPQRWSDKLARDLREKDKDITYKVYPGADHNLLGAWNLAVAEDVEFYKKHLGNQDY